MIEMIRSVNPIKGCAEALRNLFFFKEDLYLQDKFCDANDLEEAWDNIRIKETVTTFLSTLLNFQIVNSDNINLHQDTDDTHVDETFDSNTSNSKQRKIKGLYQIIYYIIHNGRRRTP